MQRTEPPPRRARSRHASLLNLTVTLLLFFVFSTWARSEEGLQEPGERCAEENAELLRSEPIKQRPSLQGPSDDGDSDASIRAEFEPGDDQPGDGSTDSPVPDQWIPSKGQGCHRYMGRRVCEGPRKVALPHGEGAERAKRLGLGTPRAGSIIQRGTLPPEWLSEIDGIDDNSLLWPVEDGRLWRGFGLVRHRGRHRLHKGVDIGAPEGSWIRSVNDGLVAYSDNGVSGYGNLMMVIHADASVAFYAHCKANYVFAGQIVRRGQVIGEVGDTGLAYGTHLHFELRVAGQAVDPQPLFVEIPERSLRRSARIADQP